MVSKHLITRTACANKYFVSNKTFQITFDFLRAVCCSPARRDKSSSDEDETYRPEEASYDFDDDDDDKPAKKKKMKAPAVRMRWSNEEKALLAKTFSVINPPVNDVVVKLQAKCPSLQKRKIEDIKARAWYFIKTGR
jgi:hypothetical protein